MGSRAVSQGLIELGDRIRQRRQEIHLSQEAFAEKVGVSVNTVSRVEGGQTAMSIEVFRKMVRVLHTSANELLGEDIPEPDGKKPFYELLYRVRCLKKSDQEIVLHTMETLIDELKK